MQTAEQLTTVTLTVDQRCRTCIVPRLIVRDLIDWDEETRGRASRDSLEELAERRCGACLDSTNAEEGPAQHFHLYIAARD